MKTSVEELIEFLTTHCNPTFCDVEYSDFILAIEQAKQKEREQIESSYRKGKVNGIDSRNGEEINIPAKDYYETTFKK